MNPIKIFRAPTLREALEQVKKELGEHALVLEHKRTRSKGFLGLGSRELVELHAIANLSIRSNREESVPATEALPNLDSLNLQLDTVDLTPMTPAEAETAGSTTAGENYSRKSSLTSFLRAGSTTSAKDTRPPVTDDSSPVNFSDFLAQLGKTPQRATGSAQPSPELEDRQPRTPQTEPLLATLSPTGPTPSPATSDRNQNSAVSKELSRIKAELREMKYAFQLLSGSMLRQRLEAEMAAEFEVCPELYDSPYFEAFLDLAALGLNPNQARYAVQSMLNRRVITTRPRTREDVISMGLTSLLIDKVPFGKNILETVPGVSAPAGLIFVGPTGVGKTTTIAKLAAQATLHTKHRVELISLDTYRIGAVEQIKTYAEIIGVRCHIARSVTELDALVHKHANRSLVLIDTVGRSPNDLSDHFELAEYLRQSKSLLKTLVLQTTTNPVDAQIAFRKFSVYGLDQLVMTKWDETSRPGGALEIIEETKLPLAYLGTGQRIPEDLVPATPNAVAVRILTSPASAAAA